MVLVKKEICIIKKSKRVGGKFNVIDDNFNSYERLRKNKRNHYAPDRTLSSCVLS